ncbi:MAG: hypothetical protein OEV30_03870, partial [Ignavibacteria bacterium]|nr:hypothetical protein [Ignavibacteria bacterium]
MVKRVAKRLMIAIGGFLLLILLIAGYSQTQMFRDQVRSFAESQAEAAFNADFYIGGIEGNLITGFSIDSLAITVDSAALLAVGRVEAEYDLFSLSRQQIRVMNLRLLRPDISVLSSREGVWNFERMLRSSSGDSMASSPFDWTITLDDLSIVDGRLSLVDSSALLHPDHGPVRPGFIEYHQLGLSALQLEIGAEVGPSGKTLVIRKLSALSTEPEFELRHFSGEFTVTKSESIVHDLTILTGSSAIELDATMKEFDLLGGIDLFALRTNPVEVALRNSDVDLNELAMFIPDIDFLNGTVSTDLEAGGTFGDLRVRRLHLAFGQTEFHVNGSVFNLHRPEDLYLDVSFRNSTAHTDDARSLLPLFDLPDFASVGVSRFDLDFVGEPLDFDTRIVAENGAGKASADIHLTIGGPSSLVYNASARFDRLDLGPLSGGDRSDTSLKGSLVVVGAGVDLRHLSGRIDLDIDSSWFYGNEMGASSFRMRADRGSLEGAVEGTLGRLKASLVTRFEDMLSDRPRFDISGDVVSLDIAEVFHDDEHRSDITMHLDAFGEGLTPGTVSGEFRLDFIHSRYQAFDLDSGSVVLRIDQRVPDDRTISLQSSLADLLVRGSFDLSYLADLIRFEQANLTAALKEKFAVVDSTLLDGTERAGLSLLASELEERNMPINTTFEVSIKDLEPISIMTGERVFDGVGTLKGSIQGDFHNLSLSAELDATELFYGTVESGFYIKGGRIELVVQNLTPVEDPFNDIRIEFATEADALNL